MFLLATVLSVLRIAGSFEVTVPGWRVLGVLGQPVVLGCSYPSVPGDNLAELVVTWQRLDDQQVVHSYYYSQDQLEKQSPNYRNRTELYHSLLLAGNASLRLHRVGPRDSGGYLCTVSSHQGFGKGEVQLEYAAFYTEPRLVIQVLPSSLSLQFETEGYPAPQVRWTDTAGQTLTAQEEVLGPGEDGLLSLRTGLTVEQPGVNLSFTLRNSALGQELQRPVSFSIVPGVLGGATGGNSTAMGLLIGTVCLLLCLGLAYFLYRHFKGNRRQPRPQQNGSHAPLA